MKRWLLLISFIFSSISPGQNLPANNLPEINFNDISEKNGLIYYKSDSTLVTGKVVRYNKKNIAQSYVIVNAGKPNTYGWIRIEEKYQVPEKKFKSNNTLPVYNDQGKIVGSVKEMNFDYENDISERNDIYEEIKIKDHSKTLAENNRIGAKDTLLNSLTENNIIIDGFWEKHFSNGNLETKGSYVNGKRNGVWEEYYENGLLKRRTNYTAGAKDGEWLQYHPNGKLWGKGNYENDKMVGDWIYYDDKGIMLLYENYDE